MIMEVNRIRKQHGQLHQEVPSLLWRSKDRPLLRGVAPGHLLSLAQSSPNPTSYHSSCSNTPLWQAPTWRRPLIVLKGLDLALN